MYKGVSVWYIVTDWPPVSVSDVESMYAIREVQPTSNSVREP